MILMLICATCVFDSQSSEPKNMAQSPQSLHSGLLPLSIEASSTSSFTSPVAKKVRGLSRKRLFSEDEASLNEQPSKKQKLDEASEVLLEPFIEENLTSIMSYSPSPMFSSPLPSSGDLLKPLPSFSNGLSKSIDFSSGYPLMFQLSSPERSDSTNLFLKQVSSSPSPSPTPLSSEPHFFLSQNSNKTLIRPMPVNLTKSSNSQLSNDKKGDSQDQLTRAQEELKQAKLKLVQAQLKQATLKLDEAKRKSEVLLNKVEHPIQLSGNSVPDCLQKYPKSFKNVFLDNERLVHILSRHHDPKNTTQKKDVFYYGSNPIDKRNTSFYPCNWASDAICTSIVKSMRDKNAKAVASKQYEGAVVVEGSVEGVKIQTAIQEGSGKIVTAFPLLESVNAYSRTYSS